MGRTLILLVILSLCPALVRSEAGQGRWQTDGHSYNLKDKLVFGRGGRRGVSSSRQRNMVEFVGGEGQDVNLENKCHL